MDDICFIRPGLCDRDLIHSYFMRYPSRSCERTFANCFLWSDFYKVGFAVVENALVFKWEDCGHMFTYPAGEKEDVKRAIEVLEKYSRQKGEPFALYCVAESQFTELSAMFPGKYKIEYDRDSADYIYETEKLAALSGKKLHAKRNHVNQFMLSYDDWKYEKLCRENLPECEAMARKWWEINGDDDPEKQAEIRVTLNGLKYFNELCLKGGALRVNGEIVAFTVGEPLNADTFDVHIEKALADVTGAYTVINQQFVLHECEGFTYVNREDDAGAEGLRKAKLSYHPAFLEKKGIVTLAAEP